MGHSRLPSLSIITTRMKWFAVLIITVSVVSAEKETVKASVKSGKSKFSCTFTLANDGKAVIMKDSKVVCTPNKPSKRKKQLHVKPVSHVFAHPEPTELVQKECLTFVHTVTAQELPQMTGLGKRWAVVKSKACHHLAVNKICGISTDIKIEGTKKFYPNSLHNCIHKN